MMSGWACRAGAPSTSGVHLQGGLGAREYFRGPSPFPVPFPHPLVTQSNTDLVWLGFADGSKAANPLN